MANMMDYLDWRGDLTFAQAPFNEVDNLLLTELVYVDFTGIVPALSYDAANQEAVFLKTASRLFWEQHTEDEILGHISMTKMAPFVMKRMAQTKRFANVCLSSYVKDISVEQQSQFCALCITLDDNSLFVSYSGTDSTIIGWRENFNMAYLQKTPGQEKAVQYLEYAVRPMHHTIRVGGHSKGGNLAVYAAVSCSPGVRAKIKQVYSNDGPGFDEDVLHLEAYEEILPRLKRVLPQKAIVGMLLNHNAQYEVVHSSENHAKQHDMLSWQVLGASMVYEDKLSEQSIAIDGILKTWIAAMDLPKRRHFIETVFSILEHAGVESVDDFYHLKWKNVSDILRSQRELSEEDREILSSTWKGLIGAGNETLKKTWQDKKHSIKQN